MSGYVLILLSAVQGGWVPATAEFSSLAACEAAAKRAVELRPTLRDLDKEYLLRTACVPKGDQP